MEPNSCVIRTLSQLTGIDYWKISDYAKKHFKWQPGKRGLIPTEVYELAENCCNIKLKSVKRINKKDKYYLCTKIEDKQFHAMPIIAGKCLDKNHNNNESVINLYKVSKKISPSNKEKFVYIDMLHKIFYEKRYLNASGAEEKKVLQKIKQLKLNIKNNKIKFRTLKELLDDIK